MTSPTSFDDRYGEPDGLRDQLRQLLRYRTTIAAGIVLGLLGGLLLTVMRAGTYTSTSEVLVRSTTDPFSTFGVSVDSQVSMGTERQIAASATVAARAATTLGEPSRAATLLKDLRVTNPPRTQVLRFEYTGGIPQQVAQVTNAFAEAYLADRKARTEAAAQRMTSGLQQQITELRKQSTAKDDTAAAASRRDQLNALQKRYSDIRSYDTSAGEIVRRAEPPKRPSGPGPAWLIGLGLLSGLLAGIVLAWLRSALEPRVRSVGEVQAALGAPVLGILPGPGTPDEPLHVGRADGSRAEAYRTLAFRLRHGEGHPAGTTLLVVAPKQDPNAEAAAVNLAAAFAEFGDDVVLVDATAGTPGVSARLPLVTDAADASGDRVVVDAGAAGRFTVRPDRRGTAPGDGQEPATAARALTCVDAGLSALVVTRPLLEHTDGLAVAQRVDGVLVIGGDHTRRDDLRRVRELIDCSGGRIVGAVLDTGTERGDRFRLLHELAPAKRPAVPAPGTEVPAPAQHADGATQDEKPSQPQHGSPAQDDTLTTSR
ncbi:hypothetical protein ABZ484_05570 [Streptomyces sp. NPDC006393]|uniref:hypothetical protein n=1 Tax=Streptomyces sp. NPDC006393 TaxID=3156763 RepID=UPI0033D51FBC